VKPQPLILRPSSGLCNRLRSIASAVALAQALGARAQIKWFVDDAMAARFDELFEPCANFDIDNLVPEASLRDRLQARLYTGSPGRLMRPWHRMRFSPALSKADLQTNSLNSADLQTLFRGNRAALLHSNCKFYVDANFSLRMFRPIKVIREQVEQLSRQFTADTIGVHIRRTDNWRAQEASPTAAFIQAMTTTLRDAPATNFFLATDCGDTLKEVTQKFPGKILTSPGLRTRANVQGTIDATVDLFALAKTSQVFGSHWSSFSHTAAEIGSIPERTIKG